MKKLALLLLSSLLIFGCTQEKETPPEPKTGVELIAIGSIHFGNVIIGEYREATIKVTNHGPDVISPFSPTLQNPFKIQRISPPCDNGIIGVGITCTVTIRFTPLVKGNFSDVFTLEDKTQEITGKGLDAAGVLDYSVSLWDLGTVVSGEQSIREVSLTNNGDFTVSTPNFAPLTGYSLSNNECGAFIAPRRTCKLQFTIIKQGVGTFSESLVFGSVDTAPYTITINSNVIPGPPSGSIVLLNPPSSIIADNADIRTISTSPIRDQFNNIVQDGTIISVIVSNLNLIGPTNLTTVGGVISFNVRATNQRGDATVTLISGAASGFARFRALAGPAVGSIIAKPYINTVVANGISQIDIRFNPLLDQFNNIVEDGTPVEFCIRAGPNQCYNDSTLATTPGSSAHGTLVTPIYNTVIGESSAIIIPPLSVGSATLIVRSGTANGNPPCGWSACGSYPIHFIPGQASGTIPVVSSLQGIFADPSSGITAHPPEVIQSSITIGPVKDSNGNTVITGSPIQINLNNAIGVSTGTSSFTVNTNGSGTATFNIQGTGARGFIDISASRELAVGSTQIWAYGNATLRPLGSSYPNNPFRVSMKYHSISTDPAINTGWGLIANWANIDIQDKNYFGDLKKQAPPTLIASNIPYYVSKCLFNSGNTTYGSACFENNFDDSSISANTLKITKANSGGDPGASRVDFVLNQYPRNVFHREVPVGCYKTDTAPGSPTEGYLVKYDVQQERCNSLTSSDPESPVYMNNFYPWFGGTWITNLSYDLKFPTVGFIPDIGRALIFGGFYQNATYGGQQNPNAWDVFISNLHTWFGNFGIDLPFAWKASNNIEDIYGDFPEASILPTLTSSNKDLYLFGGLNLRGRSHLPPAMPNTNYMLSNASDQFKVFDGILNKWFNLYPGDDPSLPQEEMIRSPTARYQHGMVYVPDNHKLFVAGGKTVNLQMSPMWFEPNDMWSVNVADRTASLQWKRHCSPCGFPNNAHNHPINLTPASIAPTPLKMTYHPYLQKVFMLWSGTNYQISSFSPLAEPIAITHTNPYSFSSIQGPNLFDMEINQDTGRTYFYNRKTFNQNDSEIYYWDMDAGNKQYMKIETDLGGSPAKTFIRRLGIHVRGYGSIMNQSQTVQGVGGLQVKIWNFTTESWDLVGSNSAKIESEDVIAQSIVNNFDAVNAPNYVSNDGKVICIITIRDTSSYSGSGYNELKLDEFYVDGLF